MYSVMGKHAREVDAATVAAWAVGYRQVIVDLGTGDGQFVRRLAQHCPARAMIGVDTCRESLRRASRSAPENALFVVADALALPGELHRLATGVTVNFPWGSLLLGLLDGHAGLLSGLCALGQIGLSLEIRLNAGALAEAGWTLEAGAERVGTVVGRAGFTVGPTSVLGPDQLRGCPTTWAKRLAYGRDPRAIQLSAVLA